MANGAFGKFAVIEHAACTYEPGDAVLLSSFAEAGLSTGGSRVVSREEASKETDPQYRKAEKPLRKSTLEEIQRADDVPI